MRKKRITMVLFEAFLCCVVVTAVALAGNRASMLAESKHMKNRTSLTGTYTSTLVAENFQYSTTISGVDRLEDMGEKVTISVKSNIQKSAKTETYRANGFYSKKYEYGKASSKVTVTIEYRQGGSASMVVTE